MKPKLWVLLGLTLISTAFAGDAVSNFDALSKIVQEKNLTTVDETAHAQESGQSFDALATLVVKNQATSIDQALSYLPETCLRPILVYRSRSLQEASPDFPRVILPCAGNRFLLAFNGSSDQKGYDTLEMIQYRPEKAAYEMRFIRFPEGDATKKIEISEANPSKCTGCHRADPRPNWDGYPLWPGVVAGNEGKLASITRGAVDAKTLYSFMWKIQQDFRGNADSRLRYRRLAKGSYYFDDVDFSNFAEASRSDAAARIARKISKNPKLFPLRYAILNAVDCVPGDGLQGNSYYRDTIDKMDVDAWNRVNFTAADLGLKTPLDGAYPNLEDATPVSEIRSIVEGIGEGISDWSFSFSPSAYSFNTGQKRGYLGQHLDLGLSELWNFLLDSKNDADLIGLRSMTSQKSAYCDALQKRSKSTLSTWAIYGSF